MNKQYESVVIINAALDDEQVKAVMTKIEDAIKVNGGEITNTDVWGRKRLAYPIQKSKSGFYVIYRFTAPTDLIAKLERVYRLDENVIRYLTIALEKKDIEHYKKLEAEKAQESTVEVKNEQPAEEPAAEEPKDTNEKESE